MVLPDDINRHLEGEFKHGPCGSCCHAPCSCCLFCIFPQCAVCIQRQRILAVTGEPYVCCGGLVPCCGCDSECPKCCICCEAFLCTNTAVAANHFYVQTRFGLKNNGCDGCLQCFNCCVSVPVCCCRVCCDVSKETENLLKASLCVCPVTHCMNAVEIREYELGHKQYAGPPAAVVMELPRLFAKVGVRVADAPVQMKPM